MNSYTIFYNNANQLVLPRFFNLKNLWFSSALALSTKKISLFYPREHICTKRFLAIDFTVGVISRPQHSSYLGDHNLGQTFQVSVAQRAGIRFISI